MRFLAGNALLGLCLTAHAAAWAAQASIPGGFRSPKAVVPSIPALSVPTIPSIPNAGVTPGPPHIPQIPSVTGLVESQIPIAIQIPTLSETPRPGVAPALLQASQAAPEGGDPSRPVENGGNVFDGGSKSPQTPGEPVRPEEKAIRLGILSEPTKVLGEKTFILANDWHYLSFSVVAHEGSALGAPTISGRPAAESELEFKETARPAPGGRERRDYSFLAIGATPAGRYAVAFPGFSFTVEVTGKEAPDPKAALRSVAKAMAEVLSRPEPTVPFGPTVFEEVRAFLGSHLNFMRRHLGKYEGYLREDNALDEKDRAERSSELESLRQAHRDAAAGNGRTLDAVITHLQIEETPVLERYKEYLRADPAHGRVFVEMTMESLDNYRRVVTNLRDVSSRVDYRKPRSWLERALLAGTSVGTWVLQQSFRLRLWLQTRAWAWGLSKPSPSPDPADGLPFGDSVPRRTRGFISAANGYLKVIAEEEARYLEAGDLGAQDRAAKTERLSALKDFIDQRIEGVGLVWTVPAMATSLLHMGVPEVVADYRSHLKTDGTLERATIRIRTRTADEFERLLDRASR